MMVWITKIYLQVDHFRQTCDLCQITHSRLMFKQAWITGVLFVRLGSFINYHVEVHPSILIAKTVLNECYLVHVRWPCKVGSGIWTQILANKNLLLWPRRKKYSEKWKHIWIYYIIETSVSVRQTFELGHERSQFIVKSHFWLTKPLMECSTRNQFVWTFLPTDSILTTKILSENYFPLRVSTFLRQLNISPNLWMINLLVWIPQVLKGTNLRQTRLMHFLSFQFCFCSETPLRK